MTNKPQDPELRALFQELREADQGGAPGFHQLWAGLRERSPEEEGGPGLGERSRSWFPRRLAWGGSLLAAAAAGVALFLLPERGTSDAEFVTTVIAFTNDPAGGAWRSPTDALLALPGSEVLNTRPSLGGGRWPTPTAGSPRSNQS